MAQSYPADGQPSTPAHTPPLSPDALKAVADLLGGGAVVAYRPVFAHVFGGAACALLLSQFWFWANTPTVKTRDGDGWFWKSQKEVTAETGLTRYETDTARRKLCALGVLREDVRGVPATLHFRVDRDRIYQLLWEHIAREQARAELSKKPKSAAPADEFVENQQTALRKTTKLVRGKPANRIAGNPQTITETPSEKTQKKTQTRARSSPAAFPDKSAEKPPEKSAERPQDKAAERPTGPCALARFQQTPEARRFQQWRQGKDGDREGRQGKGRPKAEKAKAEKAKAEKAEPGEAEP